MAVIRNRLPEIRREMNERLDIAVRKTAAAIAKDAKRELETARYSRGTEHLKDHIHIERTGVAKYEIQAGDEGDSDHEPTWYAHLVEFGTDPHTIPNAFGRGFEVEHPGASPHPFLGPAAEKNRRNLEDEVRDSLRDL